MALFAHLWESRLAVDQRGKDDAAGAWLEQLPGVVAGALLRRRLEACFLHALRGELHTYSEEQGLKVHLLRPRAAEEGGAQPTGCVVFVHGGGWLGGAPSQFYPYAAALGREHGVAAACCEFRSVLTHPTSRPALDAVADVRRCVRFLQDRAGELGIRRSGFVLAGASSGGQLAATAALGDPGLDLAGLVLFNPVLDLRFAEGWWRRRAVVWLGAWLLRLRCGAAALEEGSPLQHAGPVRYPTLVMHGTADRLVPMAEVEAFAEAMRRSGSLCTIEAFPGEGHFFFNKRVSPANFTRCLGLLAGLLASAGTAAPAPAPGA